ncbi:nicotinamide n-methyltransferase [Colletotrichum kahawae]|uniref:Nicotinamide n-methyltransferase n=1 Tax=Colletotrichum kahawae TaxID=34407 RepID=A0AAD9YEG2_COLKA|nr:nicotinamide n-methyltransferase [Colletotrichum kahawae]
MATTLEATTLESVATSSEGALLLRDLVKKEKILEKYPGFRTRDWKMDPDSYEMKSCGSESTAGDDAAYMLRIDSRASCFSGAIIHIRQSGMNQAWRLAATSGGLLSNENGTVFLITANHALSNQAYAILPPTTAALDCAAGSDDSSDGDDEPGIDSMALKTIDYTHTLVPLVQSSASLTEKKLSASTSHVEFDSSTLFPLFAVFPEERAPATSSIFAESPSMRSERSDRPALDYALIQLGSSLNISTVVSLPRRQKFIDSVPKRPERKAVFAVTASYRQIRGHLHEVPTFILHSRTGGSQEFWKATFEDEIREGDCGSWVFDARDGAVIGHIVATSPVTGLTLLVPMAQILDDVARRLGGLWVPTISLDQLRPTDPIVSNSSGGPLAFKSKEIESSTSTVQKKRVPQRKPAPQSHLEPPAEIAMTVTKRMQGIDWLDELKNLFLSRQYTFSEDQAEEMAQAVQDLLWKEPHSLAFQNPLKRNRGELPLPDDDSAYETLTAAFKPTNSQYTGSAHGLTFGEPTWTTVQMGSPTFQPNSPVQPASFARSQRSPRQYPQQYHMQNPQQYPEQYLAQHIPSSVLRPPPQNINNQWAMPSSLGVMQGTPVDSERTFAPVEAETGDKDEEAVGPLTEST